MALSVTNTVYREGEGAPLILVHAFPVDHRMWDECVRDIVAIADQEGLSPFPIWAPDMPGAGIASIPSADDSGPVDDDGAYPQALDMLADAYVDMMRAAGYDRAIWVGLSMGGYVVFDIHKRHPEAVAGLGICDTRAGDDGVQGRAKRLSVAEACERGDTVEPVMHFAVPRDGDSTVKRSPACVRLFTDWIRSQRPEGIAWRQRMAAGRPDLNDQLPLVTVPTTVVCGTLDPSSPPKVMQAMADRMTGTQVAFSQIEDCGHFSAVEHPRTVARALVALVRRV
ncbi:alpha/beta hydrolase [Bifidobacterium mongoliense]|uniref:alpha/beta fold hydrolase n=1 Tax=Bifidobacterium mongoliense TaxID=518643 RepID=UPI0030EF27B0